MDPKQTSPLGNAQTGGQEGQPVQPTPAAGGVSDAPQPVFSPASEPKMAGELGAENLSTGANVSRTMDNLNSANQSATGGSVFAKHKFDKVEAGTGDILLPQDGQRSRSLFGRRGFGGSNNSGEKTLSAAEISRQARRDAKKARKDAEKAAGDSDASNTAATPENNVQNRRTKIIIGVVVGVLVVVAGVLGVMALTSNSSKSSSKSTGNKVADLTAEEAFADYLSYLFYGENAPSGDLEKALKQMWDEWEDGEWHFDKDGKYDINATSPIYAENVMQASSIANPNRETYFEELNDKWSAFIEVYDGADEIEDISLVSLYFYNYAMIGNMTISEAADAYFDNKNSITEDYNPAMQKVLDTVRNDRVTADTLTDNLFFYRKYLDEYFSYYQNSLLLYIAFLQDADGRGCLVDRTLSRNCNISEMESYVAYQNMRRELNNYDQTSANHNDAITQLREMSSEILGIAEEEQVL